MNSSIMPKLKHSFVFNAKHSLLFYRASMSYPKAMLKDEIDDESKNRLALAERVREALASLPRGGKKRLADKCDGGKGITPQALTGWASTGRVDKTNLLVLADETNYNLEWLITGQGPKHKPITGQITAALEGAGGHFEGQINNNLAALIATSSPNTRSILETLAKADQEGLLTDQDLKLLESIIQRLTSSQPARQREKPSYGKLLDEAEKNQPIE